MSFKTWLENQNYAVIDGSMATALEKKGLNLNHKLWTAKAVVENPEKIIEVHKDYFNSGANIAITSTYQASFLGFKDLGYSEEDAEKFIRRTVKLAKTARDEVDVQQQMFIAAGVGPYGAYLADGSEYRGDYNVDSEFLRNFHEKRLEVLIDEGVDLLAIETMPNFEEIKVILDIVKKYPNTLCWVTCTLKDSNHISDGTSLLEVQKLLEENNQVVAYGINCIAPKLIEPTLENLKENRTKDLVVYPNGGAVYNPETKEWDNDDSVCEVFHNNSKKWLIQGAKLIGGCCCTTEKEIEFLVSGLEKI